MLNLFKYFNQKNQTIFMQKCFNTHRPKYDPGGKICSQGAKCLYTPSLYTTGCIAQNTSPSTSQLRRCLILQRLTKHPLLEHFLSVFL